MSKVYHMTQSAVPRCWIVKTEPATFSIDDLRERGVEQWDGVRNYQARNNLRAMQRGDVVYIYHSSIAEPAIVGEGRVTTVAYPDPTQFDVQSPYFDAKSKLDSPRWSAVRIQFSKKYTNPLTLSAIKDDMHLRHIAVAKRGNRLSVLPVTPTKAARISKLVQ
jgi:predicted RNA-binding protein with PUA-like domain